MTDPENGNFGLTEGSPCLNAGDPAGTDLGAVPYGAGLADRYLLPGKNPAATARFTSPLLIGTGKWRSIPPALRLYTMDGRGVHYNGQDIHHMRSGWYLAIPGNGGTNTSRPLLIIR